MVKTRIADWNTAGHSVSQPLNLNLVRDAKAYRHIPDTHTYEVPVNIGFQVSQIV